ncbi:MAG: RecX family transcriptional regulator [Candidatus Coatesbacteria bacterium]|nr:MAG: RecX family transcriptional regulator [Candidatus Coatesbacteria bacterium]
MGRITAVKEQKGDPSRVSVFVDGDFVCGLYRTDAELSDITVGRELTAGETEELLAAADEDRAYRYTLHFLTFRRRSTSEVEKRLLLKGFSTATVSLVVKRLTGEGYLDDAEFARAWVRDRLALKPKGKRALVIELKAKGVTATIAESAVEEILTEDEEILARRALMGFERRLVMGSPGDAKKRTYAFLIRRGFPSDIAAKLSDEARELVSKGAADDDP